VQAVAVVHPLHDAPELAGHARHVPAAVAPVVVEYVPAPQLVHETEPVMVLYVPAAQAVHTPPFGPVTPALQVQLVDTVHPLHDAPELAGHAVQAPLFAP
jgi:hypothetical protein